MSRSLVACEKGIELAKIALTAKAWSQETLAQEIQFSCKTVSNFFTGRPVDRTIFVPICQILELNWQEICGMTANSSDLDKLVPEIRQKVCADIQSRCGTMRVLDMEQPIELDDIYTHVNILEKITGRRRADITELPEECERENFDRFQLGRIRQERVPGLEAVEQHPKLMVLGKPGAGKTTFLKRLAVLCNLGKFMIDRVPIFLSLKEFAEAQQQPSLFAYIVQQFARCQVGDPQIAEVLLSQGKGLVLLDGLDEVREADHDRILREILEFSQRFLHCQFVMTCRIAAQEYVFEQFVEVEVADFDQEQIAEFSGKWFRSKKDPVKAETFVQKLKENEPVLELATNPLLLTLLCLVFGESADFPANRSELYKEGLDVLLKKWDAKRNIERDPVYKHLARKRKEDLLSQIAFTTFDRGEYFFRQTTVEREIADYIGNLPEASTDPEAQQLESLAILKSIEAQHGLLVERARGIYSFSHLTFQEYFTAQKIVSSPAAQALEALQDLVGHLTQKRWREVFLLTVGMLRSADDLLLSMKQQVDGLVVGDEKLQELLTWVAQKSQSVEAPYKPAAVRAFYLSRSLSRDLDLSLSRGLDRILSRDLDLSLSLSRDLYLDRALSGNLNLYRTLSRDLYRSLYRSRDLTLYLDLYRTLSRDLDLDLDLELQQALQALKDQLPDPEVSREIFKQWWSANGKAWVNKLRAAMIQHRDIGHDWQLSQEQKEQLKQYYDANKFLVECLNSDCYVTRAVHEEIEATLLLT